MIRGTTLIVAVAITSELETLSGAEAPTLSKVGFVEFSGYKAGGKLCTERHRDCSFFGENNFNRQWTPINPNEMRATLVFGVCVFLNQLWALNPLRFPIDERSMSLIYRKLLNR